MLVLYITKAVYVYTTISMVQQGNTNLGIEIIVTKTDLYEPSPIQDKMRCHLDFHNGTAHFFAFSIIIEGTTEKVLQFIMPLKSINNQNLGFIEQNPYF